MDQIATAALTLAGVTLAFAAILFAIWRSRRPRPVSTAPKAGHAPKFARKSAPALAEVEISPERLARISRKTPPAMPPEPEYRAPAEPVSVAEPAALETQLESIVAGVEDAARPTAPVAAVSLRLVPQIPPRDAISTNSWLGGRPRLSAGMAWPQIDDQPADFLAQIDCAALPRDLWGGLGPRDGALAFFIHRRRPEVRVFHIREPGAPLAPPFTLNDPEGWFGPHGDLAAGDLAPFAIRAFPEWPVDLVAVGPGDPDPRDQSQRDEVGDRLFERGYDIADPAFHPFDWGSMIAMVALLESRLDVLAGDPAPAAAFASDDEAEQNAAMNREARGRTMEIIGIVRDSAARDPFSPGDATAVMAALHAIRWATTVRAINPETGAERSETITLPLTTHRPDADLWVHDYQTILFDRAKHAWCADPDNLSAPARAFYEPWWQDLAAREMAAMGHEPFHPLPDFDAGRDLVLIELPSSGLMSRRFGDGGNLVVTIDRADVAAGDFSKLRIRLSGQGL